MCYTELCLPQWIISTFISELMSTVKYPVKENQWDIIFFRKCTSMIFETAECQADFPNNPYQSRRNIEVAETHYLSDRLISMKYTFSGFAFQSTQVWFIWCHVIFHMRKQFKHVKCQKKALGDLRFLLFSKKKLLSLWKKSGLWTLHVLHTADFSLFSLLC